MSKKIFSLKWIIAFIGVLFFAQCKVPYDPPIKNAKSQYLVVEGYINANGETSINLSRTRNITWGDTAAYQNELNARVVIEDSYNDVFPLDENGGGNYSGFYNLYSNGAKYRLHITTSNNKEYVSDFVDLKNSPSMDLGWKFNDGNVQIYVNAQDPNNNTHFYRWGYSETWEFHSQYYSNVQYNHDSTVTNRVVPVYVCYRNRNSSSVILGSSAKLKEDVIHEGPINLIPNHDRRISVLYSILVTQYALDSTGYNYWNAMKSNTENVGSIFDPQPNLTRGNIHCITDSSELVIGYIGAGSTQQRRLFISNSSMPPDWNLAPNCTEYEVPNMKDSLGFYFGSGAFVPYLKDSTPAGAIKGYFSASSTCVDCTLTGTPVKPSFWP